MNEEGKIDCPKCLGVGEVLIRTKEHLRVILCPKCKGKGTLDWIENIIGVKGTYIKPGIYTNEVDVSFYYSGEKILETSKDGLKFFEKTIVK